MNLDPYTKFHKIIYGIPKQKKNITMKNSSTNSFSKKENQTTLII